MARKRRKKGSKINLLPQEGFAQTTWGRILFWLLSSFRIIVIITEIIVMIAFLSRFFLDAQNSDLEEEMQQKASLIAASESFENEFRKTQERLDIFNFVTANEGSVTGSLSVLVSSLPSDILLRDLSLSSTSMGIAATSPSEKSIQQLIVNLEAQQNFREVNLTEVGSNIETPNLTEFKLEVFF